MRFECGRGTSAARRSRRSWGEKTTKMLPSRQGRRRCRRIRSSFSSRRFWATGGSQDVASEAFESAATASSNGGARVEIEAVEAGASAWASRRRNRRGGSASLGPQTGPFARRELLLDGGGVDRAERGRVVVGGLGADDSFAAFARNHSVNSPGRRRGRERGRRR